MNIYVACSSAYRDVAQVVMRQLAAAGHTITIDWTKGFDENPLRSPGAYAQEDYWAVQAADALVFVATDKPSEGASFELGCAYQRGIPIIGLWPGDRRAEAIFLYSTGIIWVDSVSEAVAQLQELAPAQHLAEAA